MPHPSMRRQPHLLDEDLVRAAEILEQYARELKASHTVRGAWPKTTAEDLRAKDDHDECLRIARRFRKVAGKL